MPEDYSGGHNHNSSRPKGTVSPNVITIPGCTTAGLVSAGTYKSSEIAGEEKLLAEVNGEVAGRTTIKVKVPELEQLWSSIVYNLTGATSLHPSNHYGKPSTNTAIDNIAFDYFYETDTTLGINDMSLVWGGLFDKDDDWLTPHNLHRVGKSVDIDRNVYDFNNRKYILIPCDDDDILKRFVEKKRRGKLICESGGRKHIEFY